VEGADMTLTLFGDPRTKKNSQRILRAGNRSFIAPSSAYARYEKDCGWFLKGKGLGIDYPVNVKCVYYMKTHRKVDLGNLLAATCDILVKYGVLKDDCVDIVKTHDGSEVRYDKENPRVEIEITEK
jgi:Holliday junction resolvase RusA-like endonuclease